jgi:hypothetical protein
MQLGVVLQSLSEGGLLRDLGARVVNILAVAGGAALGWLFAGLVVKLLAGAVSRRPVPRPALFLVRALGGTAAGLAVYFLLFGGGGSGWGLGGPGGWVFGGKGKDGTGPGVAARPSSPEKITPPTKDKESKPSPRTDTLRVEIIPSKLYAQRKDKRFYRIEGESQYRTLGEVADRIEELRSKEPAIKVVEIITYRNSIAEREGLATDLVRRLDDQPGLTVKPYEVSRDSP